VGAVEDLDADRWGAVLRVVGQHGGGDAAGHARGPQSIGAEDPRLSQQLVDSQLLAASLQRVSVRQIPSHILRKGANRKQTVWEKRKGADSKGRRK